MINVVTTFITPPSLSQTIKWKHTFVCDLEHRRNMSTQGQWVMTCSRKLTNGARSIKIKLLGNNNILLKSQAYSIDKSNNQKK